MPTIDSPAEAQSLARLIQQGRIAGAARDTAMQALRSYDASGAKPPQAANPNAPQGFLGELALGGRDIGEGVLDTFAAPHDLSTAITNSARPIINRVFGTHLPQVPTFSGQLSNALTAAGAPVATTPGEKLASAGIKGAAGALTGLGVLGLPASSANALRAGVAGVTGGASSDLAREAGAGPVGQFAAGLAGGFTPAALEAGIGTLGALTRPFTRAGQTQLAANVLRREAINPQMAAANLANASPIVPGSLRTAGEVSGDTGLLGLEKGVRARNVGAFGERISQQNAARQAELADLGGTPADIERAEQFREQETAPMRDAAFAAARQARANAPNAAPTEPVALGKRNFSASDPTEDSILQWLAKHPRGLNSVEAADQGIDPADFRLPVANVGIQRAFRQNGLSFDEAAEALHQAGYPVADEAGNYSPNVLLDQIDSELRGRPVYSVANTRRLSELEQGPQVGESSADNTASKPATITTPVHQTINDILASPQGARESIGKTMRWAQNLIGEHTDPETLYAVRQDLALAQQDRLQPTGRDAPNVSMLAQARQQLGKVISSLDDAIESGAPGYKAYLAKYRELSEPIDQMQAVQALQQKASSGLDTATGEPFLSAPQFSRQLQGTLDRTGPNAPRLTADQVQRLQNVREDLQRGNALSSPTVKAPGSDTYSHYIMGGRLKPLGNFMGHVPLVGKALRGVGNFVDQRVNDQLANAMLDPHTAAELLRRGVMPTPLSSAIARTLGRGALPAAIGPLAALPPPIRLPLPAPNVQAQARFAPPWLAGSVHVKTGPGRHVTILPTFGGVPQRINGLLGVR